MSDIRVTEFLLQTTTVKHSALPLYTWEAPEWTSHPHQPQLALVPKSKCCGCYPEGDYDLFLSHTLQLTNFPVIWCRIT